MRGSGKEGKNNLGYTFNERATEKVHMREIVRKANKVVGCVWRTGERKWGGDFKRQRSGDKRKKRRWRKIFEMGAMSGQRNTRLHSEGRVKEEQTESSGF
jgi:hypothetical protein